MDRDALIARYAGGVDAVRAALAGADDAELDARPADGGWTARECVHHLADSEARSMSRLRQLVAGAEDEIQAYDQDAWAAGLPYHLPIDGALAVLDAVRAYSLTTLGVARPTPTGPRRPGTPSTTSRTPSRAGSRSTPSTRTSTRRRSPPPARSAGAAVTS